MSKKKVDKLVPVGPGQGVYKGRRPSRAEVWGASPELITIEAKLGPRLSRFLPLAIHKGSAGEAARILDPGLSSTTARVRGHRMLEQCRKKLTQEELDAVHGVFRSKIMSVVSDAMGATTQKDFVLPRTGEIISTPPVPDHAVRLQAAQLGSKLLRLTDEGGQEITVTLIQYAPPGASRWPGADDEFIDVTPGGDRRED